MNRGLYLLVCLALFGCNKQERNGREPSTRPSAAGQAATQVAKPSGYKARLEAFLDSVGQLPTQPLAAQAAFIADSLFRSPKPLDVTISQRDFGILKLAAKQGFMSVNTARRIFDNKSISYDCTEASVLRTYAKGLIPVEYYPFGGSGFEEYALCIGSSGHCSGAWLYFLKQNQIIAKHDGYSHYGLDMSHYQDSADGKTVVYYRKEFTSGSGIWWNNYFFYKYDDNALIPILNELQNGNLQPFWGYRNYWLESFIEKTNPLTIKMVYHVQLPDTAKPDYSPNIIDDSTLVKYTWNETAKRLEGQYNQSKITNSQVLSYTVQQNDLLFINAYHHTLRRSLQDSTIRKSTLIYLNKVRSFYNKSRLVKPVK